MPDATITKLADAMRECTHPLTDSPQDYDPLIDLLGDARFVLIGEASHGTHEFYRERAEITKWLIQEKGFTAVAVEADWPDAYRVNRYVRSIGDDATSADALAGFDRFPAWMWRNTVVVNFVDWLREYNNALPQNATKVGFYGLDLYSMHTSMEAVLNYLDKVDPEAAKRARYRYSCLEHYGEDSQSYGYAASFGLTESCEKKVVNELLELQRRASEYTQRDGQVAEDEFFYAEQNARLVKNAEEYYRSMFRGRVSSMTVPPGHELVADVNPSERNQYVRLDTVIRDAFSTAERQLKELISRQRESEKAQTNDSAQDTMALVTKLFPEQDYGFLKTLDGQDIYFHRNSVLHGDFDRLEIGTGVRFVALEAEEGLRASTVQIVDKPGARAGKADETLIEPPLGWK